MLWVICDNSFSARASLGHRDFCRLLGWGKWDVSKNSVDDVVTLMVQIFWPEMPQKIAVLFSYEH